MSATSPKRPARRPRLRRLAILAATLLVVLLPALAAGARLDAPAAAEEVARVRAVLAATPAEGREPGSIPARWFFRATLPDRVFELGPESLEREPERTQAVTFARFVALLGVLLVSCCLYLLLASTRGQATGWLACFAFAALPPVAVEGAILRPEIPASAAALLAIALLLAATLFARPLRSVPPLTRIAVLAATLVASGALCGVAAAFLPQAWWIVLVPSILMMFTTLGLAIVLARKLARRGGDVPILALGRRLVFWLVAMLVWPALCAAFLLIGYEPGTPPLSASRSAVDFWPGSWGWRAPLLVVALLGVLRLVGETLRHALRGARFGSETVLLAFAAVLLVQRFRVGAGHDALLAAVVFAILVGEGAAGLLRAGLVGLTARGTAVSDTFPRPAGGGTRESV